MANLVREGVLDSDPLNRDFKNMLWRVWREIGLGKPTPLQYDMGDFLQEGVTTKQALMVGASKIIMGFRGVAKSYVTTTFAVWRLKRDRNEIVLVTSATGGFAGNISTFAWQMVSNFDFLADMKPTTDQRRSALAFDVAGCPAAQKDESFAAVSITGQITGRRASIIMPDDIETPNTSDTEGARTELRKRVAELGGAILKPGGDMYFLGTAQTEATIYREYADEKGYDLRIYPIVYPRSSDDPKLDEMRRYGTRLAPIIRDAVVANPQLAGLSTEPTRFTEADIFKRQREWGATEFDRQFKMFMDAGSGRGNPLKMRDFPVMEIPCPRPDQPHFLLPAEVTFSPLPAHKLEDITVDTLNGDGQVFAPSKVDIMLPAEEVACYVDPAGEGKDETTWTIGAGLLGRIFVCYQGASQDGHSKAVLDLIAADCKRWRVNTVEVESNFGQGMFGELLAPSFADIGHQVAIEDIRQGKVMKEARIVETLEPLSTSNRLILSAGLLRADYHDSIQYEHIEQAKRRYYRLTYQLTRMTKRKGAVPQDDRADGLSGLARHFVGVLLRQLQKASDEGKVKALALELEEMVAEREKQGLPTFGYKATSGPALGRPTGRKRK